MASCTPTASATAASGSSTVTATRQKIAQILRNGGPKLIQSGIQWTSGGSYLIAQAIDLSLPIRGIRMVFKGRLVIGTSAYASVNPEGLLNLISNILIQGTNARQKGNVSLYSIDLATAWVAPFLFGRAANTFTISTTGAGGDASVPDPGTPFPAAGTSVPNRAAGYMNGATGTYDFVITCDFPFHPWQSNALGKQPGSQLAFLVRNEEWKDSLQIQFQFATVAGGATPSALGTGASGTTVTFSAYGSGSGNPTIDVYSLPMLMGLKYKDTVLPGVLSRTTQQINAVLQSAASNITLANLQKQPTPRVIFKSGVSTVAPAFSSLDALTNVSTLGVSLGGNRNVRNNVDLRAHKVQQPDFYDVSPIQGYAVMDFMEQGNPDSSFDGQNIGDGATFQLVGTVAGVSNGFGLVLQEQILHTPTGSLLANG